MKIKVNDKIKVRKRFSSDIIITDVIYVFYNKNGLEKVLTEDNFDSGTKPEEILDLYTLEENPEYFL